MKRLGVDLSYANGEVDFGGLQQAGVEFVILRCGYGRDYPGQQDTQFEENVRKAEAAGLPWGVYHYSYARDAAGGKAEAAHALRLLKGRKPPLGVWYDMEDSSTLGGDLAGAAKAFCSAVQAAGLCAGVYANLNWWRRHLTDPVFDRYGRWVAQYNAFCEYEKPYGIWQFTDCLTIGGKKFDGNWACREFLTPTEGEEDMLSYEQFVEYMERYEKEKGGRGVSSWAREAVSYCKAKGLMKGDADGRFRPQSHITRQEVAQVLLNLKKG